MYEHLSHDEKMRVYNEVNEQRWDVMDQLAALDVTRTAIMKAIKSENYGAPAVPLPRSPQLPIQPLDEFVPVHLVE